MARNSAEADGTGIVQVQGSGNYITNQTINATGFPVLTQSMAYELLIILREEEIESGNDYSLEPPAHVKKKLVFNGARKYVNLFPLYAANSYLIGSVMNDFTDSERLVLSIHTLYLNVASYDDENQLSPTNGDAQLDSVFDSLTERIIKSKDFDANLFTTEDVEGFVYGLMLYSVERCKILVNPPEDLEVSSDPA